MAFLTAIACGGKWWVVGRWWTVGLFVLCALRATAADSAAVAPPSAEYQVKAVFLFNFAQFAEWPARAFADARVPLVIGILGDDPFGAYLDELVKNEKIGERPLAVRRYREVKDIVGCHILFVSRSEAARFDRIIPVLKGQSILTISDADAFTRHGAQLVDTGDGVHRLLDLVRDLGLDFLRCRAVLPRDDANRGKINERG